MRSNDILIVDDEIGIRDLLSDILQDEGYTVSLAENAEEARQLRNQTRPAMVLLDIWMPDCDGITLLKEWAKNGQLTMPVVMMSGHASIDTAVEATKIGAMDFLEKPIALKKLLSAVERALEYGEQQAAAGLSLDKLGNSPAIQELNLRIEAAVKQNDPILLSGEAGSPFELVARYFHKNNTPWVEPAKTEYIVDMPMELLQKAAGGILSGLKLQIPPLREQAGDIAFLVNRIATELSETQKIPVARFSDGALELLTGYDWPGNFDQLHNVVKTLALSAGEEEIDEAAVANELGLNKPEKKPEINVGGGFDFSLPLRELREELERRYFEYHISQEGQNMSRVAQKVGLERTHLYRKLKQLGIQFSRRQNKTEETDKDA